jgi:hypothetical protein
MFVDLSDTALKNLLVNSLWIIVDPWTNQEELLPAFVPDHLVPGELNAWNKTVGDKITSYLPSMHHVIVYTDDKNTAPEELQNLDFVLHRPKNYAYDSIVKYMKQHNLRSIIYCGFHEQECIIQRYCGYRNMQVHYECYICEDLVCPYPYSDWQMVVEKQRSSEQYKYIRLPKPAKYTKQTKE